MFLLHFRIRQPTDVQTEDPDRVWDSSDSQQAVMTLALCGLAAAILMAAVVLFLVRRRYQGRQKIASLTQLGDSEATRDYQVSDDDLGP